MKPELEIKELYTKAVNRCKMLDFVEAEKLFLKILEIRNLYHNPSEIIDETYSEYLSTIDFLSLKIYPSLIYRDNNLYLIRNLNITSQELKSFIKENKELISNFNQDKILDFYNCFLNDKIVVFGYYLSIYNGVFDSFSEEKRPKFTIKDSLNTDFELTVFIIKTMIEKGEYELKDTNITIEDFDLYLSTKGQGSAIIHELVPKKVFSKEDKDSLFNSYLDKYRSDSSLTKEAIEGVINVAYITYDSIVSDLIMEKQHNNIEKVRDFIKQLKVKYSITNTLIDEN